MFTQKYKPVYLKEVLGLLCQECNSMVVKCDSCKNIFSFSDRIYCLIIPVHTAVLSTDKHLCQNCYTRVVCSDKKKVD